MTVLRSREEADCLHSELTEQSRKAHILASPRPKLPLPRERFSPLADERPTHLKLPLCERVEDSYARGREVVDVARDDHKIVNQCRRCNLLVQRVLGIWHAKSAPHMGSFF